MKWFLFALIYCLSIANAYATSTESTTVGSQLNTTTTHAINVTTVDPALAANAPNPVAVDKFEYYNRKVFVMNDTLDRNVVRPTAVGYITYVPVPLRSMIQNFFNNLRDCVTLGNDVLQLKGEDSMHNLMRISINSTFGLIGLIDVSSSMGLMQHTNTFGKTMQVYGWKHSSYFVIPLLGPSTVRDSLGMIPDTLFNPTWWIIPSQYDYVSVGLFVVNGIDQRAKLLDYDQLLYTSIDPYTTMRDVYLQSSGEIIPIDTSNNNLDIDNIMDESGSATSEPNVPSSGDSNSKQNASDMDKKYKTGDLLQ